MVVEVRGVGKHRASDNIIYFTRIQFYHVDAWLQAIILSNPNGAI